MRRPRMLFGITLFMLVFLMCNVCRAMDPFGQVNASLKQMKEKLRAERLEILKQLEARKIEAEEALEALDRLPQPPPRVGRSAERVAWLRFHVREGIGSTSNEKEVEFALPLSVVGWAVEAAPKLLPEEALAEIRGNMGMDITKMDLSGIAQAIDMLSEVRGEMTLLHVKEKESEVEITIEPEEETEQERVMRLLNFPRHFPQSHGLNPPTPPQMPVPPLPALPQAHRAEQLEDLKRAAEQLEEAQDHLRKRMEEFESRQQKETRKPEDAGR